MQQEAATARAALKAAEALSMQHSASKDATAAHLETLAAKLVACKRAGDASGSSRVRAEQQRAQQAAHVAEAELEQAQQSVAEKRDSLEIAELQELLAAEDLELFSHTAEHAKHAHAIAGIASARREKALALRSAADADDAAAAREVAMAEVLWDELARTQGSAAQSDIAALRLQGDEQQRRAVSLSKSAAAKRVEAGEAVREEAAASAEATRAECQRRAWEDPATLVATLREQTAIADNTRRQAATATAQVRESEQALNALRSQAAARSAAAMCAESEGRREDAAREQQAVEELQTRASDAERKLGAARNRAQEVQLSADAATQAVAAAARQHAVMQRLRQELARESRCRRDADAWNQTATEAEARAREASERNLSARDAVLELDTQLQTLHECTGVGFAAGEASGAGRAGGQIESLSAERAELQAQVASESQSAHDARRRASDARGAAATASKEVLVSQAQSAALQSVLDTLEAPASASQRLRTAGAAAAVAHERAGAAEASAVQLRSRARELHRRSLAMLALDDQCGAEAADVSSRKLYAEAKEQTRLSQAAGADAVRAFADGQVSQAQLDASARCEMVLSAHIARTRASASSRARARALQCTQVDAVAALACARRHTADLRLQHQTFDRNALNSQAEAQQCEASEDIIEATEHVQAAAGWRQQAQEVERELAAESLRLEAAQSNEARAGAAVRDAEAAARQHAALAELMMHAALSVADMGGLLGLSAERRADARTARMAREVRTHPVHDCIDRCTLMF